MERKQSASHESKNAVEENRSFTVRTMEIGDLAAVHALGEECFTADLWPMLYRSWDEYEVTTLFNTDGDFCLVAENDSDNPPPDQKIVGFILGTVVSKTGSAWSYGYIIWLAAHPEWQREGVASTLVDTLVKLMIEKEGIRIIMADTDPDNQRAVKFFRKKGFGNEKPHIYLSSNLEHNEHYAPFLKASRAAAQDAEYLKKVRKIVNEKHVLDNLTEKPKRKKKKNRAKKLKKLKSNVKKVKRIKKQTKKGR